MSNRKFWERYRGIDAWFKPRQTVQKTLFTDERDDFLASVRISLDELDRWREKRWLSFDARSFNELDTPEKNEILFVRNIAHSGLSDAIVTNMLSDLRRPYSYNPIKTAYSFAYGWVAAPPYDEEDADTFMEDFLVDWVTKKLYRGDTALLDQVYSIIIRHRAEQSKKMTSEDS